MRGGRWSQVEADGGRCREGGKEGEEVGQEGRLSTELGLRHGRGVEVLVGECQGVVGLLVSGWDVKNGRQCRVIKDPLPLPQVFNEGTWIPFTTCPAHDRFTD